MSNPASIRFALLCATGALVHLGPQAIADLDVPSENGRYLAEVRRIHAGPGGAPSQHDRGELTVYELRTGEQRRKQWSGLHACDGIDDFHRLTDDGSTFVHVGAREQGDVPLVAVIYRGQRRAELAADRLDVDAELAAVERWIEPAADTVRLRPQALERDRFVLDLLGRDGRLRSIDLTRGDVALSPASDDGEVRVEPAVPEDGPQSEIIDVAEWSLQDTLVAASDAVAVAVQGEFPALNWELAGFEIDRDDADARGAADMGWILRVRAVRGGTVARRGAGRFSAIARIGGLPPGWHRVRVEGRAPANDDSREVRVVADDLVVSLSSALPSAGGTASAERTIALHADGRFEETRARGLAPQVALAPLEAWRTIQRAVLEMPALQSDTASEAAEVPGYELIWNGPTGPSRAIRRGPTLDEPMRGVAQALEALTTRAEGPPLTRYVIDLAASSLTVATRSAGLLSALGHDHTIAAQSFSGFVELNRDQLDGARLELVVRADSLVVADRESRKDAPEIEAEMRKNVLETARYPEIVFRSTKTQVEPLGERTWKLRLTGDLTLHGKTRSLTIPVHFSLEETELRALGDLSFRQTDWNIRPSSVAGGTIKVADEVKLSFDLRLRRNNPGSFR